MDDIRYALIHLSEEMTEQDVFTLSLSNIKKVIAIAVLIAKKDGYRLDEYIMTLQKSYELGIPASLIPVGSSLADPV